MVVLHITQLFSKLFSICYVTVFVICSFCLFVACYTFVIYVTIVSICCITCAFFGSFVVQIFRHACFILVSICFIMIVNCANVDYCLMDVNDLRGIYSFWYFIIVFVSRLTSCFITGIRKYHICRDLHLVGMLFYYS